MTVFRKRSHDALGGVEKARVGRRRVLGGIGASGLMASAAVFASSSTAHAGNADCCNLAHPPGTSGYLSNYTDCSSRAAYIWGCTSSGGYLHCYCCETAGNAQSAYRCQYN
ncbi:hypothetical protein [Streptomyces sp. NPDC093149]|uniref:hypothetical protein n=1 Tax=Streptomyces sp. NPDC093149 TaxID=3366031 RepID=UPI00381F3AC4